MSSNSNRLPPKGDHLLRSPPPLERLGSAARAVSGGSASSSNSSPSRPGAPSQQLLPFSIPRRRPPASDNDSDPAVATLQAGSAGGSAQQPPRRSPPPAQQRQQQPSQPQQQRPALPPRSQNGPAVISLVSSDEEEEEHEVRRATPVPQQDELALNRQQEDWWKAHGERFFDQLIQSRRPFFSYQQSIVKTNSGLISDFFQRHAQELTAIGFTSDTFQPSAYKHWMMPVRKLFELAGRYPSGGELPPSNLSREVLEWTRGWPGLHRLILQRFEVSAQQAQEFAQHRRHLTQYRRAIEIARHIFRLPESAASPTPSSSPPSSSPSSTASQKPVPPSRDQAHRPQVSTPGGGGGLSGSSGSSMELSDSDSDSDEEDHQPIAQRVAAAAAATVAASPKRKEPRTTTTPTAQSQQPQSKQKKKQSPPPPKEQTQSHRPPATTTVQGDIKVKKQLDHPSFPSSSIGSSAATSAPLGSAGYGLSDPWWEVHGGQLLAAIERHRPYWVVRVRRDLDCKVMARVKPLQKGRREVRAQLPVRASPCPASPIR